MPRGRGATRPGRGSDARDGAYPERNRKVACELAHGQDVGFRAKKVKPPGAASSPLAGKRLRRVAFRPDPSRMATYAAHGPVNKDCRDYLVNTTIFAALLSGIFLMKMVARLPTSLSCFVHRSAVTGEVSRRVRGCARLRPVLKEALGREFVWQLENITEIGSVMMLKSAPCNVHPIVTHSQLEQFRGWNLYYWLSIFLRNASNLLDAELTAAFIVESTALARSLQFAICAPVRATDLNGGETAI